MQGGVGDYTREIGLALRDLGCEVHVVTSAGAGSGARADRPPAREALELGLLEGPAGSHPARAPGRGAHPVPGGGLCHAPGDQPAALAAAADGVGPAQGRRHLPRPEGALPLSQGGPRAPLGGGGAGPPQRRGHHHQPGGLSRACAGLCRAPPALIPIGSNIAPSLPAGYDREAWRRRWGAGPDDLLLCFFGFVNARKGVDTLLHALAVLGQPSAPCAPSSLRPGPEGRAGALGHDRRADRSERPDERRPTWPRSEG